MYISLDWIRDFVELPLKIEPEELKRLVTIKIAEVENVVASGEVLEKVCVAQILSVKKHPEADRLNLVSFTLDGQTQKEVVCGAPNVRLGMKVPYAAVGTTLPSGITLEPKNIRGYLSQGMLCSSVELGLGEGAEGLLELDASAQVGQSLLKHLQMKNDIVLDIDNKSLTHRPDLWGHMGFAREVAAVFRRPFCDPYGDFSWKEKFRALFVAPQAEQKPPLTVRIEGESACLIYLGLSMDGVVIEPSPAWMQNRLRAVGLRPINNIVDISNYVMLEMGHPLHIFDREKIVGGEVIIRDNGAEADFLTLDQITRKIRIGDTVIADRQGPLVLAGIMGGASSGVSEKSENIFIEVANWRPHMVRKTSSRIGLRTDSSQRYEKGLDSQMCEKVLWRTVELIMQLCPQAKVMGKMQAAGPQWSTPRPALEIKTSYSAFRSLLGKNISSAEIYETLTALNFKISPARGEFEKFEEGDGVDQNILVVVPSYRATKDIEGEADLIEEVGRIHGYDNITPCSPLSAIRVLRLGDVKKLHRKIQDFMVLYGGSLEVTTYPLVGEKLLARAHWHEHNEKLILVNALSVDHDRMRPSLVPSLLEISALNQKNYDHFRLFELGRAYQSGTQTFSQETNQLGMIFYHRSQNQFLEAANTAETLINHLGVKGELERHPPQAKFHNPFVPRNWKGCHPHEYLNLKVMGKYVGAVVSVHPWLLRSIKMGGFLTLVVWDLNSIENMRPKEKSSYRPLAKYPGSHFDCTVVTDKKTYMGDLLQVLKKIKIKEMVSNKVVDIYPLSEDQKTITLRSFFLDEGKTLSGEFLEAAQQTIVKTLENHGYPLKRM